jgi:A/G-specific adenine glycosylase
MHHFALSIQVWYRQNHRELPWRSTKDPYKIWLSEIIMQQTRVDQGLAYYYKILKAYPTVDQLAKADEQEVLRLWQGLGYYSRARNLHAAAQQVVRDFNGSFPDTHKDIISLKGVGDYTAAAIASFAYDLPFAVLDGNAFRVLSRYFNDPTPIDTGQGVKVFKAYAEAVLNKKEPAEFNQAIMEIGAMVCRPKNPDCENCPLNERCLAYNEGDPLSLPIKAKKVKVTKRYFHYFLHPTSGIHLEKRTGKGIWQNMYQFPTVEVEKKINKKEVGEILAHHFGVKLGKRISSEKHILTHQHIDATFWTIEEEIAGDAYIKTDLADIEAYPLPRLIERFIENNAELFC